jgi:hypothetical protein
MKRKHQIVKFEEAIKQLEFNQFYELCKIFEIEVVDKKSIKEMREDLVGGDSNAATDFSKIKFRRDFDKLSEELIEKYHSYPRQNRRQIDRIIAKIVWANKQARYLTKEKIVDTYTAGVARLDEVERLHNEQLNVAEVE